MNPPKIPVSWNQLVALWRKPLYRNAVYLILNIGATSLLGFFFWLIVAKVYSDVEVGYSSAIVSAINLVALLSLAGLNSWIIRFLPRSDEPKNVINTAFTFSGSVSIIIAIIFLVGVRIWAPDLAFINRNAVFILVFILTAPLATLSLLCSGVFLACRDSLFTLIKDVGNSLAKIVLALAFALNFHSFGIVSSWGISLALGVGISILIFIPRLQSAYKPVLRLDKELIGKTWKYAGVSYISQVFSAAPSLIFPLIVLGQTTVQSNAHFFIAWMIAHLLFAVPMSISQSLFAEMAHSPDRESLRKNMFRSLRFVYLLVVPLLIVLLATSGWLLSVFGPGYVEDGLMLLRILAVSSLFIAFSQVYYSLLQARDRLKELLVFRCSATIAVLVGSFMVLPVTGIVGIGYIWAGVNLVLSLAALARLSMWLKLPAGK